MIYLRHLSLAVLILAVSGCGKYGKPRPPEYYAPAEVRELTVSASLQGVAFNWLSPEVNNRGRALEDLEGYRIYRRELDANSRLRDPYAKFDLIGTIEDTHINELVELKRQAVEQGQLTRKIKMDEARSRFQFVDRSAVPGKSYFYQIVAFNQGGVEGKIAERFNVLFRGEISQIARIPYAKEESDF